MEMIRFCDRRQSNGPTPIGQASREQNIYRAILNGGIYPGCLVKAFGELVIPVSLLKMVGDHNLQNLLLAIAAARLANIDKGAIAEAIATFPGVPHRLEFICQHQGVDFINDSKATNYDAAEVGLNAAPGPVILIAGGEPKAGNAGPGSKKLKKRQRRCF